MCVSVCVSLLFVGPSLDLAGGLTKGIRFSARKMVKYAWQVQRQWKLWWRLAAKSRLSCLDSCSHGARMAYAQSGSEEGLADIRHATICQITSGRFQVGIRTG